MSRNSTSVFKYPDAAETLSTIHDNYVVFPTENSPYNSLLIYQKLYVFFSSTDGVFSSSTDKTFIRLG